MALVVASDNGSNESDCPIKDVIDLEDSSLIPKVGMEFDDDVHAYEFYNMYAHRQGFSVRIRSWDKNSKGQITRKTFVCNREGYTLRKGGSARVRTDARCGCLARMIVKKGANGKLYIAQFEPTHNHQVVSSNKVNMLWSHRRKMLSAYADLAEKSGVGVKDACTHSGKQNGDSKESAQLPLEYRNYLRRKRSITPKYGDVGALLQYLQDKSANDPAFFSAIQLDKDELITNIFWADARSRADYDCFGDVVCFDTSLRANKHGWPIALFTGVNHHKQSIIFGTTLLYDQSVASFEWLFKTFEGAMKGKQPCVILTDQDQAITNVILKVWPNTSHRLCVLHIFQSGTRHLGPVFNSGNDLRNDFSNCLFHCDDHDGFMSAWQNMLKKHKIVDNEWLGNLFKEKEKWALAYGRDTFCADMNATELNESINNLLKRYLNSKLDMLTFLNNYEELVDDQRREEFKEDNKARETAPAMLYTNLLREAAKVYTPTIFEMVRKEALGVLDCNVDCLSEDAYKSKYKVTSMQSVKDHIVSFDSSNFTISCSCKKFEFIGILCCHALKVLDHLKVKQIPERYILKRWTKNAKSGVTTHVMVQTDDDKLHLAVRFNIVHDVLTKLATRALKNKEACKYLEDQAMIIIDGVESMLKKNMEEDTS
ncbi:protein FAR1-RELATED SEQUENCE 5-like isoform X1 [Nymphaea colorata]|nr:protein FAR1-RELATED SEQUENCE 5-like isoform X1 [Nymphaea colorata]XP_031480493.1 protein FAR1-RELATED SEQUENCE 5-like isoform X1 [Nymphaea colorata]XP_031480494.1 protein FAR1-RELATED SEQUENCE 5-like isoform X1 [Nymphaea colorata]XP_031480495.1 protein FAR1-RELATED SEQUENCE 5-like isoform X1 [Nymphaea colorata]XP_049932966.1 protein FAR1-RELATED SEQUENCE 5-like isoform X1 [Nymphaea colorata]